jgi:hypothetical protein
LELYFLFTSHWVSLFYFCFCHLYIWIKNRLFPIYLLTCKFKMRYFHPHPHTHPTTDLPTKPTYTATPTYMIANAIDPQWLTTLRKE